MSQSGFKRLDRVEKSLKEVVASKLSSMTSIFGGALVTVLRVNCSPDLKNARVFVSVFGVETEEEKDEVLEILKEQRSRLQHEVSKKISMKHCPKLKFVKDGAIDKLVHVSKVLKESE